MNSIDYFVTRFGLAKSHDMDKLQQKFNIYHIDLDIDDLVKEADRIGQKGHFISQQEEIPFIGQCNERCISNFP